MAVNILELISNQRAKNRYGLPTYPHGHRKKTDEEIYDCPLCDDTKGHLRVNQTKNKWHCFKCGEGGRVNISQKILKNVPFMSLWGRDISQPKELQTVESVEKIMERIKFHPLITKHIQKGIKKLYGIDSMIYEYFEARGMTMNQMIRYRLSATIADEYFGRGVLFWKEYKNADPRYFIARSVCSADPRYLNPPNTKDFLWTTFYLDNVPTKAVLVEGALDGIWTSNVIPSMAILGSELSEGQIEFIINLKKQGLKEIDILLDKPVLRKFNKQGKPIKNETDKTIEIYHQLKPYIKVTPKFLEYAKDPASAKLDYLSDLLEC